MPVEINPHKQLRYADMPVTGEIISSSPKIPPSQEILFQKFSYGLPQQLSEVLVQFRQSNGNPGGRRTLNENKKTVPSDQETLSPELQTLPNGQANGFYLQEVFSQLGQSEESTWNKSAVYAAIQANTQELFHQIYKIVRNEETAQDLFQDLLLRAFEKQDGLVEGKIGGWLFRVARNLSINYLNKRENQQLIFSDLVAADEEDNSFIYEIPDPSPLTDELAEQHAVQEVVIYAISTLPENLRTVMQLTLAYVPPGEIAVRMGIDRDKVYAWYRLAKGRLQKTLEIQDINEYGFLGYEEE